MREAIVTRERDCVATPAKRQIAARLDLIGPVVGRARLVVASNFAGGRNRGRVFDAWNCRLGRADIGLAFGDIRFAGGMQLIAEFILGLLKFFDGRAHSARQLGKLFRAKQDENDQEDDDQVRSRQIHEAGQEAHR